MLIIFYDMYYLRPVCTGEKDWPSPAWHDKRCISNCWHTTVYNRALTSSECAAQWQNPPTCRNALPSLMCSDLYGSISNSWTDYLLLPILRLASLHLSMLKVTLIHPTNVPFVFPILRCLFLKYLANLYHLLFGPSPK